MGQQADRLEAQHREVIRTSDAQNAQRLAELEVEAQEERTQALRRQATAFEQQHREAMATNDRERAAQLARVLDTAREAERVALEQQATALGAQHRDAIRVSEAQNAQRLADLEVAAREAQRQALRRQATAFEQQRQDALAANDHQHAVQMAAARNAAHEAERVAVGKLRARSEEARNRDQQHADAIAALRQTHATTLRAALDAERARHLGALQLQGDRVATETHRNILLIAQTGVLTGESEARAALADEALTEFLDLQTQHAREQLDLALAAQAQKHSDALVGQRARIENEATMRLVQDEERRQLILTLGADLAAANNALQLLFHPAKNPFADSVELAPRVSVPLGWQNILEERNRIEALLTSALAAGEEALSQQLTSRIPPTSSNTLVKARNAARLEYLDAIKTQIANLHESIKMAEKASDTNMRTASQNTLDHTRENRARRLSAWLRDAAAPEMALLKPHALEAFLEANPIQYPATVVDPTQGIHAEALVLRWSPTENKWAVDSRFFDSAGGGEAAARALHPEVRQAIQEAREKLLPLYEHTKVEHCHSGAVCRLARKPIELANANAEAEAKAMTSLKTHLQTLPRPLNDTYTIVLRSSEPMCHQCQTMSALLYRSPDYGLARTHGAAFVLAWEGTIGEGDVSLGSVKEGKIIMPTCRGGHNNFVDLSAIAESLPHGTDLPTQLVKKFETQIRLSMGSYTTSNLKPSGQSILHDLMLNTLEFQLQSIKRVGSAKRALENAEREYAKPLPADADPRRKQGEKNTRDATRAKNTQLRDEVGLSQVEGLRRLTLQSLRFASLSEFSLRIYQLDPAYRKTYATRLDLEEAFNAINTELQPFFEPADRSVPASVATAQKRANTLTTELAKVREEFAHTIDHVQNVAARRAINEDHEIVPDESLVASVMSTGGDRQRVIERDQKKETLKQLILEALKFNLEKTLDRHQPALILLSDLLHGKPHQPRAVDEVMEPIRQLNLSINSFERICSDLTTTAQMHSTEAKHSISDELRALNTLFRSKGLFRPSSSGRAAAAAAAHPTQSGRPALVLPAGLPPRPPRGVGALAASTATADVRTPNEGVHASLISSIFSSVQSAAALSPQSPQNTQRPLIAPSTYITCVRDAGPHPCCKDACKNIGTCCSHCSASQILREVIRTSHPDPSHAGAAAASSPHGS